ncbi:Rgp1-domain-containing protein [Artomyces pyxidatus]|uniref:Rgp1-domain-containing protein n=1 Tax=Artomyces pyxidatus TaxID=48021 RepID=A0ACB8T5Q2_9AGAM|nr:Rgp1-domain-containing protein [Artomyces pyxidatus]
MSTQTEDIDTALRVVVTPSQSSYFAGEPLSVTVTITNTRSPQSQPARAHAHKRSAHSVSSARLARPPTSPGLLRTPLTAIPKQNNVLDLAPKRKGLIGRGREQEELSAGEGSARKRIPGKSLSVDILPQELDEQLREETRKTRVGAVQRGDDGRLTRIPSSPRISSPLARTPSTPIPPNHPHARKASVFDAGSDSPTPIPQSASVSTFALSLDPISESAPSAIPPTPNFPSPAPTPAPYPPSAPASKSVESHAYPPRPVPRKSQTDLGLGQPPPALKAIQSDNSELVLYAYVHLTGTLSLLPPPSVSRSPALAALQKRKRGPRGGGSMDIGVASPQFANGRKYGHDRRSASFAGSLWGLLSSPAPPLPSPATNGFKPGHKSRAPSYVSTLFSPTTSNFPGPASPTTGTAKGAVGLGLGGVGLEDDEWDPDIPVPVFEMQPAMLAVDLTLGPGEERSYTYTVKLPSYLPPTYKGRTLKFSYQLSIGTCRATGGTPSSNSRVMKVPIRVYNHVSVERPQAPYDLLASAAGREGRPEGKITEIDSKTSTSAKLLQQNPFSPRGSVRDLHAYALVLMQPPISPASLLPPVLGSVDEPERGREGELTGCHEAVEILTRLPKKLSYDVNKDGVKVAVLTFMKSAWRLGETILGVVELNDRTGRSRVLKLSAMLEAHESLPSTLSSPADARQPHMRRVHAEHHASFIPQTLRTTFALDIPPDASPAFQLKVGNDPPLGGLEWKVRLCLLVSVAAEGAKIKGMVRDGLRGEWGSSWVPTSGIAPLECPPKPPATPPAATPPPAQRGWAAFFTSTFLTPSEGGFHDGDDLDDDDDHVADGEVDLGAGEEGWKELTVETVECEVPVKIWPGNTAFRPMDVVFDV